MDKVIVIRHSDEELPNTKYTANVRKNEDGSYTASVDISK
nr:MAG TPA: antitoxin [Caudoviricetes sp.]